MISDDFLSGCPCCPSGYQVSGEKTIMTSTSQISVSFKKTGGFLVSEFWYFWNFSNKRPTSLTMITVWNFLGAQNRYNRTMNHVIIPFLSKIYGQLAQLLHYSSRRSREMGHLAWFFRTQFGNCLSLLKIIK